MSFPEGLFQCKFNSGLPVRPHPLPHPHPLVFVSGTPPGSPSVPDLVRPGKFGPIPRTGNYNRTFMKVEKRKVYYSPTGKGLGKHLPILVHVLIKENEKEKKKKNNGISLLC